MRFEKTACVSLLVDIAWHYVHYSARVLDKARKVAQLTELLLAVLLPVLLWLRGVDPQTVGDAGPRFVLQEIRDHQLGIAAFLGIGVFVTKLAQLLLDGWFTDHKALKAVLESAHKVYFKDAAKDHPEQLYLHRVSLFKARRHLRDLPWKPWAWGTWPWRLWKRALSLRCRSGTAYQLSSTRLHIDDEDENANQGVAGRAWFTNAAITVSDLPEWPMAPGNPQEDPACKAYAEQGFMSVAQAASVKVKSRSVSAHVVRTRTGERWGVLVFDSRNPQGVSDSPEKEHIMELSAHLLSQLL